MDMQKKMKIITSVKVIEVPHDYFNIQHYNDPINIEVNGASEYRTIDHVTELIQGTRYRCNYRGIDVLIGATQGVCDLLSIPINQLGKLKDEIDSNIESINRLKNKLSKTEDDLHDAEQAFYLIHGTFPCDNT